MPVPNRSSMAAAEDSQMTQINHAVSVPDLIKNVTLAATRRSREIVKESVVTPGTPGLQLFTHRDCHLRYSWKVSLSLGWDGDVLTALRAASLPKQGSRLKRRDCVAGQGG